MSQLNPVDAGATRVRAGHVGAGHVGADHIGAGLGRMTASETRLLLRDPGIVFWSLAFPTVLLVILGCIPTFREPSADLGGLRVIDLYVPIVIALALSTQALQGLPTLLATYRERGILRRLRTTPMQPATLLAAQLIMMLGLTLASSALVLLVAGIAFGVALPANPVGFGLVLLLACAAVYSLGLVVGSVASNGRAASAIGSALFFPMMFFGGLWLPREVMPDVLRQIGDYTPIGAAVAALQSTSVGDWPQLLHVAVLIAWAVAAATVAAKMFRWE